MNKPKISGEGESNTPAKMTKLSIVWNASKDLFNEFAIKGTKSLINLGDDLLIKPEITSKYLKKLPYSDAIVDAAMRQAGFAREEKETTQQSV